MDKQAAVSFIRKNGKVIPIRAASGAGRIAKHASSTAHVVGAVGGAYAIHKASKQKSDTKIKVNRALDLSGLGLSIASGVVAASTFAGGGKGLLGGHAVAHAIDIAGVSSNAASVAGKGDRKARVEQGLKQEARNFVIGNAVYAAGVLGVKKNREALIGYAKKIIEYGRKAVNS